MGNMKANRKFREGEEAVSAVIGVILMVAITVAIAATVFVYVNQMATPTETGKTMGASLASTDTSGNSATFKVTSADSGIPWGDINVSWTNASGGFGYAALTAPSGQTYVAVGQVFTLDVDGTAEAPVFDMIYNSKIIWTSPAVTTG